MEFLMVAWAAGLAWLAHEAHSAPYEAELWPTLMLRQETSVPAVARARSSLRR